MSQGWYVCECVWLLYLNLSPVKIKNRVSTEAVLESWHMLRGESCSHKRCFFSSKSFKLFKKESWHACSCIVLQIDISLPKFWLKTCPCTFMMILANLKGTDQPKTNILYCHHLIYLMSFKKKKKRFPFLCETQEMF